MAGCFATAAHGLCGAFRGRGTASQPQAPVPEVPSGHGKAPAMPVPSASAVIGAAAAAGKVGEAGVEKPAGWAEGLPLQEVPTFRGHPLPYAGMSRLSEADIECVEARHLYRRPGLSGAGGGAGELAGQLVGAGRRCRYGWPQAIVYDPLYRERPGKHFRLGDTTRLTCPLLVAAIDALENGGAIGRYNERLAADAAWQGQLARTNEAHRLLRQHLVADRPDELADVRAHYGEVTFAVAMGAGLASMRPDSADVKCLHAQVADELVRAGGNSIAQQALRDIEDQGVRIDGTEECCDNCDMRIPLEQARWRLNSCKNSAGKRLSRHRKGKSC
mmetsp:Transcript_67984/g.188276  ORF Transcript_67984/g.188276 Transcript_67984/m.188276 type:complete len:331 (+) Transcript_67984:76-1068(+)